MQQDKINITLLTDSYKLNHHKMYPRGIENIYSYFESRKGAKYPFTCFFGLQVYLKKYLEGVVVTQEDIDEGVEFAKEHFMGDNLYNKNMWQHIVDAHGGKLPLRIKAVPEGTCVSINNVLMTVQVTDEKCASLTNFFETILTHVWHGSNVATISKYVKDILKMFFDQSVDEEDYWLIDYMLHDFGFRGVSSLESAGIGGLGHLVNFKGTDTLIAINYGRQYYNTREMIGSSCVASEHSVMTALGKDGEFDVVDRLIRQYPTGILSVVSDSYSIENAIKEYGTTFKDCILARDGKFVVRPDSPRFEGDTPEDQVLWITEELGKYFDYTMNKKGYKVLNPKVGVIYGDGINDEDIKNILLKLENNGWTASTCVYGMGGGLLQKHNRDTQRNAFKCSANKINGIWQDVYKDPQDKSKTSKRGRLRLNKDQNGGYRTVRQDGLNDSLAKNELVTVFENGVITKEYTFEEVRKNAE